MAVAEEIASSGIYCESFAATPYSFSQLCCGARERSVLFDSHKNGGALLGDVHLAEAASYVTYFARHFFFIYRNIHIFVTRTLPLILL